MQSDPATHWKWVFDAPLTAHGKLVALAIIKHGPRAFPHQDRLARLCSLSRTSVKSAIAELAGKAFLEIQRTRRGNVYLIRERTLFACAKPVDMNLRRPPGDPQMVAPRPSGWSPRDPGKSVHRSPVIESGKERQEVVVKVPCGNVENKKELAQLRLALAPILGAKTMPRPPELTDAEIDARRRFLLEQAERLKAKTWTGKKQA
jgi:hypothetical protein